MADLLRVPCRGCGESLGSLMCLALIADAGAKVSPSPVYCPGTETHEHDFTEALRDTEGTDEAGSGEGGKANV